MYTITVYIQSDSLTESESAAMIADTFRTFEIFSEMEEGVSVRSARMFDLTTVAARIRGIEPPLLTIKNKARKLFEKYSDKLIVSCVREQWDGYGPTDWEWDKEQGWIAEGMIDEDFR